MRKLYAYQKDGTCPVQKFVDSLNGKLKTKFLFQLNYITDERNSFAEPYVKHFSMGKYRLMYELRVKAAERMMPTYGSGRTRGRIPRNARPTASNSCAVITSFL